MKKLFLLILALCTVLTLAACGEEDHTFATKWENDATDHWHACTDEGCTEVEGKAAHTMASKGVTKPAVGTNAGEETLECSVCGYRQTQPFAALTQEAWNALFAFENVKAVGEMGGSIAEFLINGSAVQLTAENESLKNKLAQSAMGDVMNAVQEIGGIKVLATRVPDVDTAALRELGDQLRDKIGDGVVVLVTTFADKVSILATATPSAVAAGVHAGNIVKTIAAVCDGKGGGRPDSAMAGGKDVSKADAVIAAVADTVAGMLK
jgi:hypothetical protein